MGTSVKKQSSIVLFAIAVGWFNAAASAAVDFNDGGHHIIDYLIDDTVRVDWSNMGAYTEVELILGGTITGNFLPSGQSQVTMSGGATASLQCCLQSRVTVTGGTINSDLYAFDNSQVAVSGGLIGDDLIVEESSQVTVSGGQIYDDIYACLPNCSATSTIIFEGTNFAIDGLSVPYGQYFASDYSSGHLSGTLISGDSLDNDFYIYDASSIVLIPEPGTVWLLGLGAVMLRRIRRTKHL